MARVEARAGDGSAALRAGSLLHPGGGGDLKRWFSTYAQARESLLAHGGWLFPFRQQFFVCEHTFLRALGVDATDPDWRRIGFNWVEPADDAARARLESKLIALGYTR
ncbi:hypothetical protein ACN28S_04130 [Cystobacter fuscus]